MMTMARAGAIPAVVLLGLTVPAAGADAACPPLDGLPGYQAAVPTVRAYAAASFRTGLERAGRQDQIQVAGPFCSVMYVLRGGAEPLGNREIQAAYRERLARLGAQIVSGDERDTVARLPGKHDTWVAIDSQETEINVTVVTSQDPKPTLAAPGPGDFRLLGRMPGYMPGAPIVRLDGRAAFDALADGGIQTVTTQGDLFAVAYRLAPGAPAASDAEIQFNFREALKKLGAELLFADAGSTDARLFDGGRIVWVRIESGARGIEVTAVEEKPLDPALLAVSAEGLAALLDQAGHAALYLGFDPGKAELKPDTKPAIAAIASLLRTDKTLRLAVEGHTDDVGPGQASADLSKRRATALVQALTARGIAPDRLVPKGLGPAHPIASNLSGQGRTLNTRIELVKQ